MLQLEARLTQIITPAIFYWVRVDHTIDHLLFYDPDRRLWAEEHTWMEVPFRMSYDE